MSVSDSPAVHVIGAGLAGSEAALTLARYDVSVVLHEMRPHETSPAHHTDSFAELVCSNSLKSDDPNTAAGLLKVELGLLGSQLLEIARGCAVPAGGALAVDRLSFGRAVTEMIERHPSIEVRRARVDSLPPHGHVIVATGPLTSDPLATHLKDLVGSSYLSFFDAAAPVVEADSIDRSVIFAASRYGKGEGADYLNAPMEREEYENFVQALVSAERVITKDFERKELFRACQPVEEIARTGLDALRYGPLKPVGIDDPRTGRWPWAVVQLRAENRAATAYNLVGFQTNLTWPAQREVFSMIPGLEHAEFLRFGVMHRNTFLDAPRALDRTFALKVDPRVRIAGQLAGTEGYTEAIGSGLMAALNTISDLQGLEPLVLPRETAFGALLDYATDPATGDYQPMHVNFGLVPPLDTRIRGKRDRYAAYSARAITALRSAISEHPLLSSLGDRA